MKYILIEVQEREINTPDVFGSHEEAHDEMCARVAEALDVPVADIKESYLSGEEYNENTVVTTSSAWTERHGNNYDWKIFKCEEVNGCATVSDY